MQLFQIASTPLRIRGLKAVAAAPGLPGVSGTPEIANKGFRALGGSEDELSTPDYELDRHRGSELEVTDQCHWKFTIKPSELV